jgi:hypothetical protein
MHTERPENTENTELRHPEDLPPRQERGRPANAEHTDDVLSQREIELSRQITQKETEIKQIKISADELLQRHIARIHYLEQDLTDYNAYMSKKEDTHGQELHQRDQEIKQLNANIAKLRKDNQDLGFLFAEAQENALKSMLKKTGWAPKEDPTVREEFSKIETKLRTWTRDHGALALRDIEKDLQELDKNKIIQLLDGYCIQTDWQTLMTKMSISQNKIPAILLQSILARDIFEWAFADPFFLFTEMENSDSVLPKSNELKNLYTIMRQGKALGISKR